MLMLHIALSALAVVVLWLAQISIKAWSLQNRLKTLPHPEVKGLLGTPEVFENVSGNHRLVLRWVNQYGGIFWMRVLQKVLLVVTDPSIVPQLLARGGPFEKPEEDYRPFRKMLSRTHDNMVSMKTNECWRTIRKAVAPTFNSKRIRDTFPFILDRAKVLCAMLHAAGPQAAVQLDDMLQKMNIEVIGKFGYDKDWNYLQGEGGERLLREMKQCLDEVERTWKQPFREYIMWWKKDYRQAYRSMKYMHQYSRDLLAESKACMAEGSLDDGCFMARLLQARSPTTRQTLEDELLVAQIGVLFFAGFETTAHTTFWTIYLLSQHPEVEEKLCRELNVLGLLATAERPHPRDVTYADINNMKYLAAVIQESMRLLPVAGNGTSRVCTTDVVVRGIKLPKGTRFWIPFYAMFRSQHNFERGDAFEPERWLTRTDAEGVSTVPAASKCVNHTSQMAGELGEDGMPNGESHDVGLKPFVPFSDGARDCVGRQLAQLTVPLTVATLMASFRFEMTDKIPIDKLECARVTLQPCEAATVRAIPRA